MGCAQNILSHITPRTVGARTGDTMETLLIAWCVWAGVILFLCPLINRDPESSRMRSQQTAPAGLDYIRISIALLSEWEMHQSNLLIIDLRSDTTQEGEWQQHSRLFKHTHCTIGAPTPLDTTSKQTCVLQRWRSRSFQCHGRAGSPQRWNRRSLHPGGRYWVMACP